MKNMENQGEILKIAVKPDERLVLTYTVTEERIVPVGKSGERKGNVKGTICYSLSISSDDGVAQDEICFEDIARTASKAASLAKLLARETVTPETAAYIVEELISFGTENYLHQ